MSICARATGRTTSSKPPTTGNANLQSEGSNSTEATPTTSSLCAGTPAQILLQTARLELVNTQVAGTDAVARAILDSGSQRTYISSQLRERLNLPTTSTERIRIKTFGSTDSCDQIYDVVHLGVKVKNGETLTMAALVVPFVCSPLTSQPIDVSREVYEHFVGLTLQTQVMC